MYVRHKEGMPEQTLSAVLVTHETRMDNVVSLVLLQQATAIYKIMC